MSNRDIAFYLVDIFIAIDKIRRFIINFKNGEYLLHSELEWDAVMRELQLICDATNEIIKYGIISITQREVLITLMCLQRPQVSDCSPASSGSLRHGIFPIATAMVIFRILVNIAPELMRAEQLRVIAMQLPLRQWRCIILLQRQVLRVKLQMRWDFMI